MKDTLLHLNNNYKICQKKCTKNLKEQQKHANEEIDHFIERTWATYVLHHKRDLKKND
jgi:hypothetical protein